jgi:mRNA interferase YafQ
MRTRTIEQASQFKRDLKREAHGQHRQALKAEFVAILAVLANDQALADSYRDHALTGEWKNHRECHIKPDLLLIYQKRDTDEGRFLRLARLGSHSELFS